MNKQTETQSMQTIKMPSLSDTMETGHLVRWLKKPGDKISKGDILAEIESDKSVIDMEAFDEGYLVAPLAEEDTDIAVGAVMAYLSQTADNGEQASPVPEPASVAEKKPASSATDASTVATTMAAGATSTIIEPAITQAKNDTTHSEKPASTHQHAHFKISPYARGLARELGIDPALLTPGASGIIKSPQVIAAAMQGPQPDLNAGPAWRYRLFTPMHRAIASNMSATVNTPVFHISTQLPTDDLQAFAREKKLSLTLLLARALALSVKKHPDLNATYTPLGLAVRKQVDVGIAVDRPGGLVTPVVRDAASRSMEELTSDWQQLKQKVRSARLQPRDYQGATIYLSNLGMFEGVSRFNAIVPTGACAILAVAASQDGIAELTLSVDHRVVYGAEAARFLQTLKTFLATAEKL